LTGLLADQTLTVVIKLLTHGEALVTIKVPDEEVATEDERLCSTL